eukprot:776876-Rhodomonas_salina.1
MKGARIHRNEQRALFAFHSLSRHQQRLVGGFKLRYLHNDRVIVKIRFPVSGSMICRRCARDDSLKHSSCLSYFSEEEAVAGQPYPAAETSILALQGIHLLLGALRSHTACSVHV